MEKISFDQLPAAVGMILNKLERLDEIVNGIAATKKHDAGEANNKRLRDAKGLAKYLKCPISTIYGKQHRGQLPGKKMPGSRKLYYDLDEIDALMGIGKA